MGIVKETFGTHKNILIAPETALTLGARVTNTGIDADSDGRKILKAGTPLYGDIQARDTAFVKATTTPATEQTPASTNAVCVILHDVDVTAGAENATIVLAGCVDLLKLDATVQTLIDSTVVAKLDKIVFVKGGDR